MFDNLINNTSNDDEINILKNQLNKANKIIAQQKATIDDLQNKLNNYYYNLNNNIADNFKNIIYQKDLEINNLKSQLNNINYAKPTINANISNNVNININDIMCVNFIATDQSVHFAAACAKTNTFAEVEEKLYKQYPKLRETNNEFIANGAPVLRFKTIEQNKIGNGLPVTLLVPL